MKAAEKGARKEGTEECHYLTLAVAVLRQDCVRIPGFRTFLTVY